MTPYEATALATRHGIKLGRDFFTLGAFEVTQVLCAADEWRYRKPKNANGSRGRYFYAFLNRAANRN